MTRAPDKPDGREQRRLQTRRRLMDAAKAEFKRVGVADADVAAIAAAAGVARATFYFHFPTKEHVVLELERREEARIAAELARFLESRRELAEVLDEVVRLVVAVKRRLGATLFREVLALHFSPTRPPDDEWTDHPVIVGLVAEIERRRAEGEIHAGVDPFHSAVFFLFGLYGLLSNAKSVRVGMLENYIAAALRGMVAR